jgi:hypothetical protein
MWLRNRMSYVRLHMRLHARRQAILFGAVDEKLKCWFDGCCCCVSVLSAQRVVRCSVLKRYEFF